MTNYILKYNLILLEIHFYVGTYVYMYMKEKSWYAELLVGFIDEW
jgi:hypothetical protein